MEMLTFFSFIDTLVAFFGVFFYLAIYMATFNTDVLFEVRIHGFSGCIAAQLLLCSTRATLSRHLGQVCPSSAPISFPPSHLLATLLSLLSKNASISDSPSTSNSPSPPTFAVSVAMHISTKSARFAASLMHQHLCVWYMTLLFQRIDYCNAVFASLPFTQLDRMQRVTNAAAKLVRVRRREHITLHLRKLKWLLATRKIEYKLAVHASRCLCRCEVRPQPPRCFNHPRWSDLFPLVCHVWNSLLNKVTFSPNFPVFRARLKSHMLARS